MQIPKQDLVLLYDIYDNSLDIIKFTKRKLYYHYEKDRKTRKAVERSFEMIGIACNKVSKETKEYLCHIPWGQIIALRNVIAHEYDELRNEKIWFISRNHVPELVKELKKINDLKKYMNKE